MSDTFWIQLFTLVSVLAGFYHNYRTRKRQRDWDIADRQAKFDIANTTRKEVSEKTDTIAIAVKENLMIHDGWEREEWERIRHQLEEIQQHLKNQSGTSGSK